MHDSLMREEGMCFIRNPAILAAVFVVVAVAIFVVDVMDFVGIYFVYHSIQDVNLRVLRVRKEARHVVRDKSKRFGPHLVAFRFVTSHSEYCL